MLDNVFEKLGIYDLIVVFFTGVTILVFSFLINDILFKFTWIEIVYTESIVIFCVISYFIGMCLQEISSLLCKYLFKNDNPVL